ncbi:MAG: HDIG domain-containing protein [Nitriliruptorales bacterium]|nr:HDIG domain-containing protein [Nitriliruptorales bacterium]
MNRRKLQRLSAGFLVLAVIPAILTSDGAIRDRPVVVGSPSPRTIVAPDLIRVVDPMATDAAQREAAETVEPELVVDDDAVVAIVQDVREAFSAVRSVSEPDASQAPLTIAERVDALEERLAMLDERGLRLLAEMSDLELGQVAAETIPIAQLFAREAVREERIEDVADRLLRTEFNVRQIDPEVADAVVEPILRDAFRPTVRIDDDATSSARQKAADAVADVVQSYPRGQLIVSEGDIVNEVQLEALRARGLEGSLPWRTLLESLAVAMLLTLAIGAYLRAYRPRMWGSGGEILLLACLLTFSALALQAAALLPAELRSAWSFVVPVGGVAMLITILLNPPVGALATIPQTVLAMLAMPGEPAMIVFVAIVSLVSVPLVSQLSARGDLRRAALRSTVGYAMIAGVCAGVFVDLDRVPAALLAGLASGVLSAIIVNGSLPFLESTFGIMTATGLLDLADRNHPLLRELEQKALGSYNHSIAVSTMVERAARAIGANALLAGVAALYHDIGKVRRPYFFVENQIGIANPHDELDPRASAMIIQEHVTDGVSMAHVHRLPPEVVEGIATHHGTTLVSYFHRKALANAGPTGQVKDEHFRYKGRKPSSREMAVLMLADCCEGAARATAQNNRNLSKVDLERIVRGLIAERIEDGQLDESSLTFRDLTVVQRSFIETLTGVYHPRITYPERPRKARAPEMIGQAGFGAAADRDKQGVAARPAADEVHGTSQVRR